MSRQEGEKLDGAGEEIKLGIPMDESRVQPESRSGDDRIGEGNRKLGLDPGRGQDIRLLHIPEN